MKLSKKDKYYLKMLNAEAKYISKTGGEDCNEPFITPILFSLLDTLNFIFYLLFALLGALLASLAL